MEPPNAGEGTQAERLTKLADLHRQGVLSDDEFEAAAARLVSPTPPGVAAPPTQAVGQPDAPESRPGSTPHSPSGDSWSGSPKDEATSAAYDGSVTGPRVEARGGRRWIAIAAIITLALAATTGLVFAATSGGRANTPSDAAMPTMTSLAPSAAPSSSSPPPPAAPVLPSGTYRWSGTGVPLAATISGGGWATPPPLEIDGEHFKLTGQVDGGPWSGRCEIQDDGVTFICTDDQGFPPHDPFLVQTQGTSLLIWTSSNYYVPPPDESVEYVTSSQVSVPNVVAMSFQKALSALRSAGFLWDYQLAHSLPPCTGNPTTSVETQRPSAGSQATTGKTIHIVIAVPANWSQTVDGSEICL
jgi:hypothetical protein